MAMGRPIKYNFERVLDSATNIFWRQGYEATSLNNLLEKTGLSKSSLYQIFGSKRKLFLRCLEYYQNKSVSELLERMNGASSGKQFIEDTLTRVVDEVVETTRPQGCLVVNTAIEFAQHDADVASSISCGLQKYQQIFYQAILRGQKDGSIRSDLDASVMANYLVTNMSGLRTMVKAGTDITVLKSMIEVIIGAFN